MLALTTTEIGLGQLSLTLIVMVGLIFIFTFILTSINMDTKGLLRVLYAKPIRTKSGKVEYRKKE